MVGFLLLAGDEFSSGGPPPPSQCNSSPKPLAVVPFKMPSMPTRGRPAFTLPQHALLPHLLACKLAFYHAFAWHDSAFRGGPSLALWWHLAAVPGASARPLSTPLLAALQVRATPHPQLGLQRVGLCTAGYLGHSNGLDASNACWSGQV